MLHSMSSLQNAIKAANLNSENTNTTSGQNLKPNKSATNENKLNTEVYKSDTKTSNTEKSSKLSTPFRNITNFTEEENSFFPLEELIQSIELKKDETLNLNDIKDTQRASNIDETPLVEITSGSKNTSELQNELSRDTEEKKKAPNLITLFDKMKMDNKNKEEKKNSNKAIGSNIGIGLNCRENQNTVLNFRKKVSGAVIERKVSNLIGGESEEEPDIGFLGNQIPQCSGGGGLLNGMDINMTIDDLIGSNTNFNKGEKIRKSNNTQREISKEDFELNM